VSLFAAIDVGTNTVRLLVCDDRLRHIERAQRITRLGKGVDATGRLDAASVAKTLDAVVDFTARARDVGAAQVRVAGTSALRDAANGQEFLHGVRDATGLDVEILSGEAEGRCAYAGATSWLPDGSYVICDIGGGSTEVITKAHAVSLDIGSVRLKERFFNADPPGGSDIEEARTFTREMIAGDCRHVDDEQLVGVAGTITTLTSLVLGLTAYDSEKVHGARVTRAQVDDWSARLLAMPSAEIAAIGPVQSGREDVIGSGSLILSVVMEILDADDVLVSERDILDGLVMDLIASA
jgi:exopolyphosphatase/guanosine-5'-triphosphate,3'-diphosphate pyrophosphatase